MYLYNTIYVRQNRKDGYLRLNTDVDLPGGKSSIQMDATDEDTI